MATNPPITPTFLTTSRTSGAPPTLSIQLPFILLGNKIIPLDKRMDMITQTFANPKDEKTIFGPNPLPLKAWIPERFEGFPVPRMLRHEDDERKAKEDWMRKRWEWEEKQRGRWEVFEENMQKEGVKWVISHVPISHIEDDFGLILPFKGGDGLFTAKERKMLGGDIWAFPFLLQRFGVEGGGEAWMRLESEVRQVYEILRYMNQLTLDWMTKGKDTPNQSGEAFKVVVGSKCWGRVAFEPVKEDDSVAYHDRRWMKAIGEDVRDKENRNKKVGWDEATIANLFLLFSGFEKEFLTLMRPNCMVEHWPLSHFLFRRAVESLRREKHALYHEIADGDGDGKEKEERWNQTQKDWIEDMRWQDEVSRETEQFLGERRAWVDEVWDIIRRCENGERKGKGVRGLVADVKAWEARRQRIGISFQLDKTTNAQHEDIETNSETFPCISSLCFPLPRRNSLDPEPVLAHIKLLVHVVLFAGSRAPKRVYEDVKFAGEVSGLIGEGVVERLGRLWRTVGLDEDGNGLEELQGHLQDKHPETGIPVHEDDTRERDVGKVGDRVDNGIFSSILNGLGEGMEREGEFMREFLEGYEGVGGFLVPGRMRVFEIMEGRRGVMWKRKSRGVERWVDKRTGL
ncbi:hypothetical protein P280DRAFT_313499 [Massarina eburnea CBS 473.64]|uniref:Uncharacterized protein n=1 Tax=Massarina eburnea CBS 473.64 TaxID=1395130 RepID=A0A6A6S2U5_9PLEO|nr:hypothetical protein P280DRAFT_313499 [Massarina eburnea CBS 473.64]